jgi:recA bacterial DNA recombination protein
MRNLSLVKNLSRIKEEQKYSDEIWLEATGLALTRGTIVEMAGVTGKTSLLLSLLAKLTREGEICAVVDSANSFDPASAVLAKVELRNLLWVKCAGNIERAFMAADYLVQAKGFGAVWLNLNGIPRRQLKQVPRTFWYRYRNRIKETPTLLLVTAEEPIAGSASQNAFVFSRERTVWSGKGRFKLLREFHLSIQSRKEFYGKPLLTKAEFDYGEV